MAKKAVLPNIRDIQKPHQHSTIQTDEKTLSEVATPVQNEVYGSNDKIVENREEFDESSGGGAIVVFFVLGVGALLVIGLVLYRRGKTGGSGS